MRSEEIRINAHRQAAIQHLGIDAQTLRVFEGQQANLWNVSALLRLPVEVGDAQQDAGDGTLFFMAGFSPAGGSDPVTGP